MYIDLRSDSACRHSHPSMADTHWPPGPSWPSYTKVRSVSSHFIAVYVLPQRLTVLLPFCLVFTTPSGQSPSKQIIERVSTRVVVIVVVLVAQPDCLPTHVSSVTEPKSHSSLPKHLPLHTEESLEKVHPATNFTNQSLAASL